MSFICGRCTWLEEAEDAFDRPDELPEQRIHLGVPMGMMSLLPDIPVLGRWGMLVEEFSTRSLTYEQDVETAFPGGLLHGLPIFFFDIALLWRPTWFGTRRTGHPSWSWEGWKGPIKCLTHWVPFYPGV